MGRGKGKGRERRERGERGEAYPSCSLPVAAPENHIIYPPTHAYRYYVTMSKWFRYFIVFYLTINLV